MTRTKTFLETNPDPFYQSPEQQEPTFEDMAVREILPSKTNISIMAHNIKRAVEDGKVDAKKAAVRLTAMEQVCKETKELIRDLVLESGSGTVDGCKVEQMEAGTKYDFTANPGWIELNNRVEQAKSELKTLETYLKTIPAGKEMIDASTGEVFYGPSKTSTTTFKVTLAK